MACFRQKLNCLAIVLFLHANFGEENKYLCLNKISARGSAGDLSCTYRDHGAQRCDVQIRISVAGFVADVFKFTMASNFT